MTCHINARASHLNLTLLIRSSDANCRRWTKHRLGQQKRSMPSSASAERRCRAIVYKRGVHMYRAMMLGLQYVRSTQQSVAVDTTNRASSQEFVIVTAEFPPILFVGSSEKRVLREAVSYSFSLSLSRLTHALVVLLSNVMGIWSLFLEQLRSLTQ